MCTRCRQLKEAFTVAQEDFAINALSFYGNQLISLEVDPSSPLYSISVSLISTFLGAPP